MIRACSAGRSSRGRPPRYGRHARPTSVALAHAIGRLQGAHRSAARGRTSPFLAVTSSRTAEQRPPVGANYCSRRLSPFELREPSTSTTPDGRGLPLPAMVPAFRDPPLRGDSRSPSGVPAAANPIGSSLSRRLSTDHCLLGERSGKIASGSGVNTRTSAGGVRTLSAHPRLNGLQSCSSCKGAWR